MERQRLLGAVLVLGVAACGGAPETTTSEPNPTVRAGVVPPPSVATTTPEPRAGGAPYPIVLMHGMGGFDKLSLPVDVTYFSGIVDALASNGEKAVFVTVASPFDTSEDRAPDLAMQIDAILKQTGKAKVNLIGHSQGGMDARVLASPAGLAMGDKIASVTTIATPHRGSRVADLVLGLLQDVPPDVVDQVTSAVLDLLEKTAYDVANDPKLRAQLVELSEAYMAGTFNPKYVDDPRVAYTSYGGRTNWESGAMDCAASVFADDASKIGAAQPALYPTAAFLQGTSGTTNDGLVTIDSARWGTFFQCVPADHLQEVGQIFEQGSDPTSGFDHLAFFRNVVARIRVAGF
jgi:triacylglycerol lipase